MRQDSKVHEEAPAAGRPGGTPVVVPLRHPGRWVTVAVLLVLTAMFVHTLYSNSRFEWGVVRQYFTSTQIMHGLARTIELTVVGMLLAVVLGVVLAVMRQSRNPLMSGASQLYIWIFRGTPLLVQILFWFNVSALYPRVSFGIPFGPELFAGSTNAIISAFVAALLGLALNEAAYMAEIVRAGIISVDVGQHEASSALGMSRMVTMRRIVLPQALRVIIPPTGNELITMLKNTSLVSVIGLPELLYSAQLIYSQNYLYIPLLIVATFWYLIITSILTVLQLQLEKKLRRGTESTSGGQAARRLLSNITRAHPREGVA